jgi:hypothetical protein
MVEAGDSGGVRAGLKDIVADYAARGVDLAADPRLAEAVLLDSFPESPAEVRGLVEAIRSGSIQQMRDRAGQGARFSIEGSASQLAESAGLREDLARWVAESWWSALSLGGSDPLPTLTDGTAEAPSATGDFGTAGVPQSPPDPVAPATPGSPMTVTAGQFQAAPAGSPGAPVTGAPFGTPQGAAPPTVGTPPGGTQAPWTAPAGEATVGTPPPGWGPTGPASAPAPGYGTLAGPAPYQGTQQPWPGDATQGPGPVNPPTYASQQAPGGQGWNVAPPAPPAAGFPPGGKVAVIAVVAVVLVYLLAAAGAHLPPFAKANKTVTSSSTTKPLSNSTTSTTGPTGTTGGLSAGDTKLLSVIPNSSNGTCIAATTAQIPDIAPGATAVEGCNPVPGAPQVEYAIFPSSDAAETFYVGVIVDVNSGDLPSGDCSTTDSVEGGYTSNSETVGNLACYFSGSKQELLWYHFSDDIVASTDSSSLSLADLYHDWLSEGPQ